ncbi:MAG: hypothetical protein LW837_21140, partial [Roseomonas sp.]|nr:hypothetical protein [Roseomonas sp.]
QTYAHPASGITKFDDNHAQITVNAQPGIGRPDFRRGFWRDGTRRPIAPDCSSGGAQSILDLGLGDV